MYSMTVAISASDEEDATKKMMDAFPDAEIIIEPAEYNPPEPDFGEQEEEDEK